MAYWYDAFIIDTSDYLTKNYVKAIVKNINNIFKKDTGEIINPYTTKDYIDEVLENGNFCIIEIPKGWGGYAYGEHNPPPLYSWCYVMPKDEEKTRFILIGYNNYGYPESDDYKKNEVLTFQHPLPSIIENGEKQKQTLPDTFIKSIKLLKDKDGNFVAPEKYPIDYFYKLDKDNLLFYKRKLKKDGDNFSDENLDLEKQFYNIFFINDDGAGMLIPTNTETDESKIGYTYFSIENEKINLEIKDSEEEKQKLIYEINEIEENKFNFSFVNKDEETTSFILKDKEINANITISDKEQSNIKMTNEEIDISVKKDDKNTKINFKDGEVNLLIKEDKTKIICKDSEIEVTVNGGVILKIEKDKITIKGGGDEVVLWSKLKDIISKLESHKHPTPSGPSAPSTDLAGISGTYNNCKAKAIKTD